MKRFFSALAATFMAVKLTAAKGQVQMWDVYKLVPANTEDGSDVMIRQLVKRTNPDMLKRDLDIFNKSGPTQADLIAGYQAAIEKAK